MSSYYEVLAADRLRRCYDLAPPEVQAYLTAEITAVRDAIQPGARVIELGCGYGRVLAGLGQAAGWLAGVDLSLESLALARRKLARSRAVLARMDVAALAIRGGSFDLVYCPQNGISAFHVDQRQLIEAAVRLLAPRGRALFFSYAEAFWPHRLEWFRIQAAHGLVGEIDEQATGDGTIVCRDGFTATTVSPSRFVELTRGLGVEVEVSVLAASSVMCSLTKVAD